MSQKKGQGSTRNGRNSPGQRLGLKCSNGQYLTSGSIILRQRGTQFHPGLNVGLGSDHTLFAKISGYVEFKKRNKRRQVSILLTRPENCKPAADRQSSAVSDSTASPAAPEPKEDQPAVPVTDPVGA